VRFRYFNRDVECIRTFFQRRFRYESAIYPRFKSTVAGDPKDDDFRLDVIVEASGFGRREMKVLEQVCSFCSFVYVTCALMSMTVRGIDKRE
jgi:RIO-like serine/threonine protein kinase